MKRLKLWIRDLSLVQQLISIIFFVVFIFILFFTSIIIKNIDNIVDRHIFNTLRLSQNSIVDYIAVKDINSKLNDSSEINHFVYNVSRNHNLNIIEKDLNASKYLLEKDVVYNKTDKYYYYASKLEGNNFLISYINREYQENFRSSMLENVIYLNIAIVIIFFALLMLWLMNIIHSLNVIKNHISSLSKGIDSDLKINRRDEIGDVAQAINYMHSELLEQERVKEEMVQNISHDLKTPIATIKSYGESIKDGIFPYDTLEKSVDVIIEHADRLEKKVYSLLMLNKMEYLKSVNNDQVVDMVEIIDKVILSLKVIRKDAHITKILNPTFFVGEEEPWRIVVENLFENAIRYAKSEIVVTLNNDELEISNDGPLLSDEILEKIFKPYEKGTGGNFGLGLSIVHRICETYGYNVVAENLEDGVMFRISKIKYKNKKAK